MKARLPVQVLIPLLLVTVCALPSASRAGGDPAVAQISTAPAIEEIVLQSEVLEEERRLMIRLPRDYGEGRARYPVLLLLDAEWHFNLAAADVEFLSECSYIDPHPTPALIVVGVVNTDRNRDFTPTHRAEFRNMRFPTSGGAERFRRFLVDEVLPAIDATYRTHPYRILAGWSLGGLFTIDTLLSDMPRFDSYLAVSPSLWWDDGLTLKRLEAERSGKAAMEATKKLTVTLGGAEVGSMVARSTNEFLAYLAENPLANVEVEQVSIADLGHNYSPAMAYFMGLATLFADWNLPAEVLGQGLAAIDTHYASLSASYGFTVPVPEDAYSTLGWKLFESGRREEAGEVFRTWAVRHPRSAVAQASLGSFHRETGDAERAAALLQRAVEIEEQSASPRPVFISDLKRDLDAIRGEE